METMSNESQALANLNKELMQAQAEIAGLEMKMIGWAQVIYNLQTRIETLESDAGKR